MVPTVAALLKNARPLWAAVMESYSVASPYQASSSFGIGIPSTRSRWERVRDASLSKGKAPYLFCTQYSDSMEGINNQLVVFRRRWSETPSRRSEAASATPYPVVSGPSMLLELRRPRRFRSIEDQASFYACRCRDDWIADRSSMGQGAGFLHTI